MKTLEELGTSPAPWATKDTYIQLDVYDRYGIHVAGCDHGKDACLIAAAPDLYTCLREATIEYCAVCEDCDWDGPCEKAPGECPVQEWRNALAKAAGEGEVK